MSKVIDDRVSIPPCHIVNLDDHHSYIERLDKKNSERKLNLKYRKFFSYLKSLKLLCRSLKSGLNYLKTQMCVCAHA